MTWKATGMADIELCGGGGYLQVVVVVVGGGGSFGLILRNPDKAPWF